MKIIVPPLKSQGIKTKLVPTILSILPEFDGTWIEPFLGTGVVAFNVKPEHAILGDVNPHIINFYKSIQNGTITVEQVREYLEDANHKLMNSGDEGYDYFREVRDRFNEHYDPLDFLFLSRSGFNGMMRFNRKGEWNIPFCKKPKRFSKSYVTKIINQIIAVSQVIKPTWEFKCTSYESVLKSAKEGDFIYCDPPYHGRYVDYYNSWTVEDEMTLHKMLVNSKAKFILSTWKGNNYRSNALISLNWKEYNLLTKEHFYHSGGKIENRNSITEALIYNYDIIPKIKKPDQTTLFELLNLKTDKTSEISQVDHLV